MYTNEQVGVLYRGFEYHTLENRGLTPDYIQKVCRPQIAQNDISGPEVWEEFGEISPYVTPFIDFLDEE